MKWMNCVCVITITQFTNEVFLLPLKGYPGLPRGGEQDSTDYDYKGKEKGAILCAIGEDQD